MTSKISGKIGIGFYKFPSNPTLRKKWMNILGLGRQPKLFDKVCGGHFKPSDIICGMFGNFKIFHTN